MTKQARLNTPSSQPMLELDLLHTQSNCTIVAKGTEETLI